MNIAILGLGNLAANVLASAFMQIEGARLCEVVSIKSLITRTFRGGPHDETVIVSMQFESGATAEFCSSVLFESPFKDRNLFFYDFRSAIRLNQLDTSSRKYRNDKAKRTSFPLPITLRPDPAAM